jgi:hypothetical protein
MAHESYKVIHNEQQLNNSLQSSNHQTYDYVRMLDNQMDVAVSQCVEAATNEFDVDSQKLLLDVSDNNT